MTTPRKRGSLAGLMPAAAEAPPMPVPAARRAAPARPPASRRLPNSGSSEVQASEVRTPGLPKYKRLERKETLLWPDQLGELTVTRRMLNRGRGGAGERITENTLIRVAVALLMSRRAELAGTTEDELRRSLGLD
jgi:hypothetical protein